MHYYQFNLSDYITATAHLTPIQDIAYRRLLDFYYEKEKPIPNETDWISNRIRLADEIESVVSVLKEFFILTDGNVWVHDVCDVNIKAYQKRCRTNKANSIKGGRPKKTESVSNRIPNQEPRTKNQEPLKPLSKKNAFSTDDHDLAIYIHSKIKELNPNAKDPNLDKWANEIRLMRERDKRSHDELIKIFTWANNDPFWRTNILSPAKLRKQFDQLTIKSKGENNGTHQQPHKPSLAERATNARREFEQQNNDEPMGEANPYLRS